MIDDEHCTFGIRVNDGPEQTITVKTGIYIEACAAVPALLGIKPSEYPLRIMIWVPDLIPQYGPYTYYIEQVGGRLGHICKRWDNQEMVIYS
jgi:hypothetical protein